MEKPKGKGGRVSNITAGNERGEHKPVETTDERESVQPAAATNDVAKVLELLNKSPELTSQLLQLLGGVVSQGTLCAASAN